MAKVGKKIQQFVHNQGLEILKTGQSFQVIVDKDTDYFRFDSGLVVCIRGEDVFVMHSFNQELDVLDESTIVNNILDERVNEMLTYVNFSDWQLGQKVSSDIHPSLLTAGIGWASCFTSHLVRTVRLTFRRRLSR